MGSTDTGQGSRWVTVGAGVRAEGNPAIVKAGGAEARGTLPGTFYTIDGYAPFAAQMLLLRYWKQHGEPRVIRTVPGLPLNDVVIATIPAIKGASPPICLAWT